MKSLLPATLCPTNDTHIQSSNRESANLFLLLSPECNLIDMQNHTLTLQSVQTSCLVCGMWWGDLFLSTSANISFLNILTYLYTYLYYHICGGTPLLHYRISHTDVTYFELPCIHITVIPFNKSVPPYYIHINHVIIITYHIEIMYQ